MNLTGKFLAAMFCLASVLMLGAAFARSDVVTEAWVRRFSNFAESIEQPKKVLTDGAGNVIVVGNTDDGLVGQDWLIIKYSNAGGPLWTNRFNGPENGTDTANAAALDASGNVIVSGPSATNNLTIKYSANGREEIWEDKTHFLSSHVTLKKE